MSAYVRQVDDAMDTVYCFRSLNRRNAHTIVNCMFLYNYLIRQRPRVSMKSNNIHVLTETETSTILQYSQSMSMLLTVAVRHMNTFYHFFFFLHIKIVYIFVYLITTCICFVTLITSRTRHNFFSISTHFFPPSQLFFFCSLLLTSLAIFD